MGQFGKTRGEKMGEALLWHIENPIKSALLRLLFFGLKVAFVAGICAAIWVAIR